MSICCVAWCVVIPTLAVSISAFVIAVQEKDTDCDEDSFISLSTWLIVFGSVNLGSLLAMGIAALCLICSKGAGTAIFIITIILTSLWTLAWNIVGAVALFRDSMDCLDDAQPLWIMTLVALILQWVSIFQNCCMGNASAGKN